MNPTPVMQLYSFFRSGTSHRLRIALNLKGLSSHYTAIDLRVEAHLSPEFKAINPQGFVPVLKVGDDVFTQSPAIIEWLEETYPQPALIPGDAFKRFYVRALAAIIGCDVHPINNRRILERLRKEGLTEAAVNRWAQDWIVDGFDAFEALLLKHQYHGQFCCGETPSLADAYLIPQVESSQRFKLDLKKWPLIQTIYTNCMQLEAFAKAQPSLQPDAS